MLATRVLNQQAKKGTLAERAVEMLPELPAIPSSPPPRTSLHHHHATQRNVPTSVLPLSPVRAQHPQSPVSTIAEQPYAAGTIKRKPEEHTDVPWFWDKGRQTSTSTQQGKFTKSGEFSAYYSLPHQHVTGWVQPKSTSPVAFRNTTTLRGADRWR